MNSKVPPEGALTNEAERWIAEDGEIYVIVWYVRRAGEKDYLLVTSVEQFRNLLSSLRTVNCAIYVFRHPQFPIRGIASDTLLATAQAAIPDGQNWFLLHHKPMSTWDYAGFGDSTHLALKVELQRLRGQSVLIGPDVHWPKNDTSNPETLVIKTPA